MHRIIALLLLLSATIAFVGCSHHGGHQKVIEPTVRRTIEAGPKEAPQPPPKPAGQDEFREEQPPRREKKSGKKKTKGKKSKKSKKNQSKQKTQLY